MPEASELNVHPVSVPTSGALPRIRQIFRTAADMFGVFRVYTSFPLTRILTNTNTTVESASVSPDPYWPYPNLSSFLFGNWFWARENKSRVDRDKLLSEVLLRPEFSLNDLRGVNFKSIDNQIVSTVIDLPPGSANACPDGWKKTDVLIDVPIKGSQPLPFRVSSLHYRSLVSVIRDVFTNEPAAKRFTYQPYREYWRPPWQKDDERLYGELYTSEAFNKAHEVLQKQEAVDNLPRAVAAMMLWSDSTHLTSFGQAKLWPLYLYFGNQSKYERCQPSCRAAHHVAYFPSVCFSHEEMDHNL